MHPLPLDRLDEASLPLGQLVDVFVTDRYLIRRELRHAVALIALGILFNYLCIQKFVDDLDVSPQFWVFLFLSAVLFAVAVFKCYRAYRLKNYHVRLFTGGVVEVTADHCTACAWDDILVVEQHHKQLYYRYGVPGPVLYDYRVKTRARTYLRFDYRLLEVERLGAAIQVHIP